MLPDTIGEIRARSSGSYSTLVVCRYRDKGDIFAQRQCEIPKAPQWDVGVLVPYSSDTLTLADFLPDAGRMLSHP